MVRGEESWILLDSMESAILDVDSAIDALKQYEEFSDTVSDLREILRGMKDQCRELEKQVAEDDEGTRRELCREYEEAT